MSLHLVFFSKDIFTDLLFCKIWVTFFSGLIFHSFRIFDSQIVVEENFTYGTNEINEKKPFLVKIMCYTVQV